MGVATPPNSETRYIPECEAGAKMMTPRAFQSPPRPKGASASATAGPPSSLIFFNLPSAKNPIERPSGDQNGKEAPSVPSIGSADNLLSSRTQTRASAFESTATNASFVPSVLSATDPPESPMRSNVVPAGGKMKDRLDGGKGTLTSFAATRTARAANIGMAHNSQR